MINLLFGLAYSIPIAFIAFKKDSLSKSGAIAAVILGSGMYFFGGLIPSALMVTFFISSSLLSKLNGKSKKKVDALNEKGSRRDYIQVFANGGVALILSILYNLTGNFVFLIAIAISFAEANSDTWASEIGVLSKKPPMSILNFKPLESGISGGVSILGTVTSFVGALIIAVVFGVLTILKFGIYENFIAIISLIIIIGFSGSIIDSVLGAAIQAAYWDDVNNRFTEKRFTNGKENRLIKGFNFINNDRVNILSNIITVIIYLMII